jgi:hypothetical protein
MGLLGTPKAHPQPRRLWLAAARANLQLISHRLVLQWQASRVDLLQLRLVA